MYKCVCVCVCEHMVLYVCTYAINTEFACSHLRIHSKCVLWQSMFCPYADIQTRGFGAALPIVLSLLSVGLG